MKGRPWAADEVAFLVENQGRMRVVDIARELGRSVSSVNTKRIGLREDESERFATGTPWTDEDLGFVAEHPDWSARRIADAIGRSEPTVVKMRRAVSEGYERGREFWKPEEDGFVLATPNLTARRVAEYLGKTERAVVHRRCMLREVKGARFNEFDKNPHHVGGRPLLAKTCRKCGRLLAACWFYFDSQNREWRFACTRCCEYRTGPRPKTATQILQTKAAQERKQALTRQHAERHGEPWLETDDAVLANPDLTLMEKALRLGRTYAATTSACHRSGYASKIGLGDPDRDQWLIDNPSGDVLTSTGAGRSE